MGLLSPDDWSGQWLAVEDSVSRADRQTELQWISGPAEHAEQSRKFRFTMLLPTAARSGSLFLSTRDRLIRVWIDGEPVPLDGSAPHAIGLDPPYEISIDRLSEGTHLLAAEVGLDSVMPSSASGLCALARFDLDDGRTFRLTSGPEWRTRLTEDSLWFAPDYDDSQWERVLLSPSDTSQLWPPMPGMDLRTTFRVDKPLLTARLYATALGAYEAYVNGNRVGDALLTPESTLYSERALYRTYDLTELIVGGANVLGMTVGDGWYASYIMGSGRYAWGPPPRRVLAQLDLTFIDGSQERVATGPGWRICESPIIRSEIYDGEIYDARREHERWGHPDFDDSDWEHASVAAAPSCRLSADVGPPIRATETLRPRTLTQPQPGVWVFDFGQNFAGWCRLHMEGHRGTPVEMRFGETLQASGLVDQSNLRRAKQTDVYIMRGAIGGETFEPHFTYHGFRYVQVSGFQGELSLDSVVGVVVHSDCVISGSLSVDDPLIQRIWRNTLWTQRSNFMGIATDCPQRDERFGYLADAAMFWDAATFNMDLAAYTRRQMRNASDSQHPAGAYSPIAPRPPRQASEVAIPGFSDGSVILPWTGWWRYGDVAIIEENWEGMTQYLEFIRRQNPNGIWEKGWDTFGDWMAVDQQNMRDQTTPPELISTAYWAHSVELVAQMALAIEREDTAASLQSLHQRISDAFTRAFVTDDGRIGNGSQTSYVLALRFGLVPTELRRQAADQLAADISQRGGALSTGYLGTQYVLDVLAESGYGEVVYDLLLRTEYPSWGYMIANQATTIWEGWDGTAWSGVPGEKIPGSHNHYALGAICGFLFRRIAGIDCTKPGFEDVLVRPLLDPRVKRAQGTYDSVRGRIATEWEQEPDGRFLLDLTIPANTRAEIHLPASPTNRVMEGGREISDHDGVRVLNRSGDEARLEVDSGAYHFEVAP